MCEYCGCQAVPAIAELTREHDLVVNIMAEIRSALDRGQLAEAAAGCRRILAVLMPHTRVEEEALFPALRGEFPDQVDSLQAEHRGIEAVLAEAADATPADPAWPDRLRAVLYELREHILKEQNGVFPATLAILDAPDWDRIDQVRAKLVQS